MSANAVDLLSEKRRHLFKKHGLSSEAELRSHDVRRLLVLLSASRSGSSLLFRFLAQTGGFVSPIGEETPFYRLNGIGSVRSFDDSDLLGPQGVTTAQRDRLVSGILSDLGESGGFSNSEFPVEDYALDCTQRLMIQWPSIDFDPDRLYESARSLILETVRKPLAFQAEKFWSVWITSLTRDGFAVDLGWYDLSAPQAPARIPAQFLEEPPFIVPLPRRRMSSEILRQRTVVLKSSSNCYRVALLKTLFPDAEIQFVLLRRNPAAGINGLMDGWTSPRFQSHDLSHLTELRIRGYSSEERAGSRAWWKFDLPPGWKQRTACSLEEVCAFQWSSANRRILDENGLVVHYENLLAYSKHDKASVRWPDSLPVVMGVHPPREKKWLERRDQILPIIQNSEVTELAARMGYDVRQWKEFV